ncbi:hypothetical protein [Portibacter marinus]|uniref:hypothetical protein n=1 Tax=Portibacter marinus TaxID=2898660 RepID=UPI001F42F5F0|nr:hypothetical protein [Portibacter marinus]
MESIIQIFYYISIISGGLLFILLLLSILGGMDLDLDLGVDTEVDAGGLGIVKSGLTFIAIGSYTAKLLLGASTNPILTILLSLISGVAAVFILSYFLRLLLSLQSNVNWDYHQAEGKNAEVYLRIPEEGTGLIKVNINGVNRELKAKASEEIATGSEVLILQVDQEVAEVILYKETK